MGLALRNSTGIVAEEEKEKLASLFDGLNDVLNFAASCSSTDADEFARRSTAWAILYMDMGCTVTPYLHILKFHFPMTIALFGSLGLLNGELVEKANDEMKRSHLRKTDRKHPKQTLQIQLRIEYHNMQI